MDILQTVHLRAKKIMKGQEHLSYEERLRELGLLRLEERRLGGVNLIPYKHLMGGNEEERVRLFYCPLTGQEAIGTN